MEVPAAVMRQMFLWGGATFVALSACSPVVPASPTWKDDIHPLVVARCVRCHSDPPAGDPATSMASVPAVGFNLNYPASQPIVDPLPPGLIFLRMVGVLSVRGQAPPPTRRMPPPPAESLEDWQIEMLKNWAANPR